jgi:hypothetical protein
MYFPVAYDPLMKAETKDGYYTDHENEIFKDNGGATALSPVEGTVPQNKEGFCQKKNILKLQKNTLHYMMLQSSDNFSFDPKIF